MSYTLWERRGEESRGQVVTTTRHPPTQVTYGGISNMVIDKNSMSSMTNCSLCGHVELHMWHCCKWSCLWILELTWRCGPNVTMENDGRRPSIEEILHMHATPQDITYRPKTVLNPQKIVNASLHGKKRDMEFCPQPPSLTTYP